MELSEIWVRLSERENIKMIAVKIIRVFTNIIMLFFTINSIYIIYEFLKGPISLWECLKTFIVIFVFIDAFIIYRKIMEI